MQAKIDHVQASLYSKMKHANSLDGKRVIILVSEKILRCQQQLTAEDSQDVKDLNYRMESAVAKERRFQTTIASF